MTAPTVAHIGPTGLLGSEILKALLALPAGAIKLVVVHRASSKLPSLPEGVEKRQLDIDSATEADVATALRGVDIVLNTSGKTDPAADLRFLDHLSKLKIRRYIPSDYALNYTAAEVKASKSPLVQGKIANNDKARSLGIPLTVIHNGVFEPFALTPFDGVDIANATLTLYGDAENKPLDITSLPYLATAVAEIVQLPEIKDTYTVTEFSATGKQIADAIEKATGKKVAIKAFTEDELTATRDSGDIGALIADVRRKWSNGDWAHDDEYEPKKERRNITIAAQDAVKRQ